jgi:hypothetical protein
MNINVKPGSWLHRRMERRLAELAARGEVPADGSPVILWGSPKQRLRVASLPIAILLLVVGEALTVAAFAFQVSLALVVVLTPVGVSLFIVGLAGVRDWRRRRTDPNGVG